MSNSSICTQAGHAFHGAGEAHKKQRLLSVMPGIPLLDALQEVSDLLSTIEDSIHAAAMGEAPLEGNSAWLVDHALATAKAVLDCVIDGAMQNQDGGAQ